MKTITGTHNGHTYRIHVEYADTTTPELKNRFITHAHYSFDGTPVNPNETIWHKVISQYQQRTETTLIECAEAYIDTKWGHQS